MHLAQRADGDFDLRLGAVERRLIGQSCAEVRSLIERDTDDPVLERLFPPGYRDDPEREAFYQQMAREELRDSRIEALALVERTVGQRVISASDLEGWLIALNTARLVLGTYLGITDDGQQLELSEDDPAIDIVIAYEELAYILETATTALLRAGPPTPPVDEEPPGS